MTATIRRYMRAMGSIMDIMPATDYRKLIPTGSDAQRLRSDMMNISKDMNTSIVTVGESANAQKLRKTA
ncbi:MULTISPECIES: hypothetical protein [Xenorhabdus]|uniref:hypothetical protein n=1 Tax=Xenorhabdus TaxID=626 RepID=UPI000C054B2A|nr:MULTISPECIES: hypothetical protein [unclassified Xenorhabdus]PHM47181.1 hypothetical protein Xekk_04524 [Xenorhabdus sp. KK7.4]PHM67891.1 hypothetical protein Xekj_03806 [Xenorhabdus sp. KJ12.1]